MKKIYLVRHGESNGNASGVYQNADTPLTEKGRAQAEFIASRCEKFAIDFIVSSSMKRAVETAAIVNKKLNKLSEISDLFVERRRPKAQMGLHKGSPKALEIDKVLIENFVKLEARFSDEENFEDLRKRAGEALEYLKNRTEENILVITHGFFLRMIMARAVFDDKLVGEDCNRIIRKFHTANTGLSVLGYDEYRQDSPWWLWVWNDHAHLG
ncbi:MAG: Phosphoglycerate mutase [Microgenomates group bacterium GW2011_GWC2_45_8]|nr:MAG: Phosphoglycerate mutase [Parcubacteria group bacterium GW2011_GWA2_42_18]KKT75545.1 MAG: Phosphoglycerate mutase [Parcubacteria group bacterium GW2011_GWB1_44_7]KKU14877.1 MAG: Phosphoglycerate mutase [Microgenomates group bacterium GW2011_GWC2_45_8]